MFHQASKYPKISVDTINQIDFSMQRSQFNDPLTFLLKLENIYRGILLFKTVDFIQDELGWEFPMQ